MKKVLSLIEWIEAFDNYEIAENHVDTQRKAGWYDWFCKDDSLANKTKSLGKKVKQLAKSKKIDCACTYVFFKNNCACVNTGTALYDSFSFCDIESGDVLYWITPRSAHTGEAEVCQSPNFGETAASGKWKDIKNFFEV